ncbi:MAG TPA: ABC transporter ATP-binding protein [Methylomirabilota bacterium]|nr:ABC transporter ATP-binding protein [Methylomirabilota bacterium]
MAALLALQDVSRSFGSLRVIDGLSLAVADGEALGVIGPNGAGKTTALNLMIGRLRPERGAVVFDGRDVTRVAPHVRCRTGIALTHQIPHPFEDLTVFENVLVGGVFGGARGERSAYAPCLAALELSGLAPKANIRAGALTLLERKRLELARALATSPRVLLLDEIAGGLAEQEVHELVDLIRRVQREGVAIIWIEHIVHALRSVVSRLAVISAGRLLTEGAPDDVMASPEVQRVYLGIDVQ